jgi:hypothetical protein
MLWRIWIEIDGNPYISLRITGLLDFIHRPELSILENTFRILDLFPSSGGGRETPTQLGPLEELTLVTGQLRTERDPVSQTLCFLVFRIPDDGQSPERQ